MRVVKGLLKLGALAFIIIALFIYIYDLGELIIDIFDTVFGKIELDTRYKSVDQRLDLIKRGINDVERFLLEVLVLVTSSKGLPSNINWYLFLASETGIFTVLLFVSWFAFHLIQTVIKYIRTSDKIFLIFALSMSGSMLYLRSFLNFKIYSY